MVSLALGFVVTTASAASVRTGVRGAVKGKGCFLSKQSISGAGLKRAVVIAAALALSAIGGAFGAPKSVRFYETLDLNSVHWQTSETFDDGEALFEAVCAHELEGVVAKRSSGYRPGDRAWVKTKSRCYWRWEMEHESAINRPRVRHFV